MSAHAAAAGGLVSLNGPERARYEALFAAADGDKDGVIGPADAAWFLSLGLDKTTLSEVWRLSDGERRGFLSKDEFFLALRLVALARLSRPLSIQDASPLSAPQFGLPAGSQPSSPAPMSAGAPTPPLSQGARLDSMPSSTDEWSITPTERGKFAEIFDKADDDKDGFVTGPQARQLFSRSGLEMEDLGRIWALSDVGQDHKLDVEEFIIAMYLINARLKARPTSHAHAWGRVLPSVLPPALFALTSESSHTNQPHQHQQSPAQSQQQHQHQPPPSPIPSPATPVPHSPQQQQPQAQSLPGDHHSEEEQWVMTADERSKYEDVFTKADDDKDGFVSGEQARTMFSRSQLPLPDLAKIWALADYGKDHRLDKEEFVIAMYFINARLKGRRLPDVLPQNLTPGSAAQSMGSLHTSLSSSQSSLNPSLAVGPSPPGSSGRVPSAYGSAGAPAVGASNLAYSLSSSQGGHSDQHHSPSPHNSTQSFRSSLLEDHLPSMRAQSSRDNVIPSGGYSSTGAPMPLLPPTSAGLPSPPLSGSFAMGGLGGGLSASASSLALGGFGPADSFDNLAGPPSSGLLSASRPPASPQLNASLQSATHREADIRARIDDVKNLAQQQYKINEEFQRQLDAQLAINAQLEEDLRREEERADRLAEESLALSAEWEAKKEEGDASKAKLEAAVERSLRHATKLQEVQVRMQALMTELAAGREQLKKAEKEAKSKKKAALKEEKELESLQAQIAALKQEKADATAARSAMESRAAAARETTQRMQDEASQLAAEVAALQSALSTQQQAVHSSELQQLALNEQIRQLEQEKEQVRASLAALEIQSQQQQQQHQQQQQAFHQQQQQFIQSPQLQSSLSSATPPRSGPSALPSYAGGWDNAGTVTASPPASFQGQGSMTPQQLMPDDPFGSDFFGSGGASFMQQPQGGQVNFFDMAVGAGGIDPVETRDFFGSGSIGGNRGMVSIPSAAGSGAPASDGFAFDPFASFEQHQQQQQQQQQAPSSGPATFFSSDDAFA